MWTYPPRCVAENRKGVPDAERARYCLYTNTFLGEYGLSLLARPEAAANVTSLLLDAYHSAFPNLRTVSNFNDEPSYKVVDMPDKGGKGVVATRHIKRTETFIVDHAAIIGDLRMWGSVSEKDGRALLDLAAKQLVLPELVTDMV